MNGPTKTVFINQDINPSLTIFIYVIDTVILISCTFYFISYLNSDIYSEIFLKTVPNLITETFHYVIEAVNNNSLIVGQELDIQLISFTFKIIRR
jgi:hypothetical protein